MKILKVKSRTYKGKHYYKYRINIPGKTMDKACLRAGDRLDVEVKKWGLKLKKK